MQIKTSLLAGILQRALAGCALLWLCMSGHAASIDVAPITPTSRLLPGALVTFEFIADFSTNTSGLGVDTTIGGGIDVNFDPTALGFVELYHAGLGDPQLGRAPDILEGRLEAWAFASFDGITGPALIGSVTFVVLATGPVSSVVSTSSAGWQANFFSAIDYLTPIDVDYQSATVTRIPLPGALGFMLMGLGSLAVPLLLQSGRCFVMVRTNLNE